MPAPAAETVYPAWMPSRSELLLRPLEYAYAIDPANPVEIDDAFNIETISVTQKRVAVYIADIGLIKDEDDALSLARKRGWTRYRDDCEHTTMFEEGIWKPLGLDQRIHNIGAPAVKIAFSFNPETGRHGDVDFAKVRIKTQALTYRSADRILRHEDGELSELSDTTNQFAVANGFESAIKNESKAKQMVASFMVMTNFVVASEMEKAKMPWLYRNHGKKALEAADKLSDMDKKVFNDLMKAIYQVNPAEHTGLGLAAYCHITSGLRRFPDAANGLNLDAMIDERDPFYTHADMRDISAEIIDIYKKEIARAGKYQQLKQAA